MITIKILDKSVIFFMALVLFISSSETFAKTKNIVLVHTSFNWSNVVLDQIKGFKETMGNEFVFVDLLLDINSVSQAKKNRMAANVIDEILKIDPVMVYLMDDNALNFVGKHMHSTIPLVFSSTANRQRGDHKWLKGAKNIQGVMVSSFIIKGIVEVNRIFKLNAKKVLVLMSDTVKSKQILLSELASQAPLEPDSLIIDLFISNNFNDWKSKILSLESDGYDMFMVADALALQDDLNIIKEVANTVQWISNNSAIPGFSIQDEFIGKHGLVAGLVSNGYFIGASVADIAMDVLQLRAEPHLLVQSYIQAEEFKYSQVQVDRWGLKLTQPYHYYMIAQD
ncbi:MAG: hypothetical protein MJK10_07295 [Pseudomonadales bacterium]|nr:hypothetical protein [Pseudomonadales bacterium]NRA13896.1 hypothetical protein [Oceanospirillaceae bacterium]